MRQLMMTLGLLVAFSVPARANVPTRFTVQGVLRDGSGALQTTSVTFTVRLWQSQTSMATTDLLFTYAPAAPNNSVMAANGLFTISVTLAPADVAAIAGALGNQSVTALWLEVTANGYVYARQPLTEVLSAIFADSLSPNCTQCVSDGMVAGGISGLKVSGPLTNATIDAAKVTNLYAVEPTTSPALLNDWVNYAPTSAPFGYFKDPFGIVHLRGTVKEMTSAYSSIFVLPAGYRPLKNLYFPTTCGTSASLFYVGSDGTLSTDASCPATTFLIFEGATFRAEQ
jgi:hypothetical protein